MGRGGKRIRGRESEEYSETRLTKLIVNGAQEIVRGGR